MLKDYLRVRTGWAGEGRGRAKVAELISYIYDLISYIYDLISSLKPPNQQITPTNLQSCGYNMAIPWPVL